MDCDNTLDPCELLPLADLVSNGTFDLVLGARGNKNWSFRSCAANKAVIRMLRRRTGLIISDVSPMRVANRRALLSLNLTDRRFGWPLEMLVRGRSTTCAFTEVPVSYYPRIGVSKVTGTVGGTLRTIRDMRKVLAQ